MYFSGRHAFWGDRFPLVKIAKIKSVFEWAYEICDPQYLEADIAEKAINKINISR